MAQGSRVGVWTRSREVRFVSAATLVILCVQIAWFYDLRHDDAFITYRYARNLWLGHGLVFNPGERVMGSTSAGHVLLACLVYPVAGWEGTPSVMSALGCVGWTAQALAVVALLRSTLSLRAYLVAAFVALGGAWSHRYVALETNLAAAAGLWTLAAAFHRRWTACAFLAAIAGLLRPDAYVLGLPVGILCVRDLGRKAWKPFVRFLAVAAVWPVFATLYYGTPIPQSATVKIGEARSVEKYATLLLNFIGWLTKSALDWPGDETLHPSAIALVIVAAVSAVALMRRNPRLVLLPHAALAYFAAYTCLRAGVGTEWHQYPIQVIVAILVVSAPLVTLREGRLGQVATVLTGLALIPLIARTSSFARGHKTAQAYGGRHGVYVQAAAYLRAHPDAPRVIATEPGTMGYYSDFRMIDRVGLVTPDLGAALLRVANEPHWVAEIPSGDPRRCTFSALSPKGFARELGHERTFQVCLKRVSPEGRVTPAAP